jgi:ubiquitin carboxyl-terminal hydrolase 7
MIVDSASPIYLFLQINDRYEFPLQLDLDRENGKYLSPEADCSVRNLYTLHRYQLSHAIWQHLLLYGLNDKMEPLPCC